MVAEKPSVAKLLAEHLSGGRMRTRRGQSRANQIFEFIKYFGPAQQKCKLMVTSVVGHVYGLNFEVSWETCFHFISFLVRMEEYEILPNCSMPRFRRLWRTRPRS